LSDVSPTQFLAKVLTEVLLDSGKAGERAVLKDNTACVDWPSLSKDGLGGVFLYDFEKIGVVELEC